MKKLFLLLVLSFMIIPIMVLADDTYYINHGRTEITSQEYDNLLSLGFEEREIYGMSVDEFNANRNLTGEIVHKATLDLSEFPQLSLNPDENIGGGLVNYSTIVGGSTGETNYKKLTVYIISVNDGAYYRFKNTLEWQQIPYRRSWDVIAIGYDSSKLEIGISTTFYQEWCTSSTNCDSSFSANYYSLSNAEAVVFKLRSGTLTSLRSYMYFSVIRRDTTQVIPTLTAVGDYAHATSNVSTPPTSSNMSFLGEIWLTQHASYYDSFPEIDAVANVNWGA